MKTLLALLIALPLLGQDAAGRQCATQADVEISTTLLIILVGVVSIILGRGIDEILKRLPILLLGVLPLNAATVTYEPPPDTFDVLAFAGSGDGHAIDGGWYMDLRDYGGSQWDQTFTLTSTVPLYGIAFYADNYPWNVGSGFTLALDGAEVLTTGWLVPVQTWVTVWGDVLFTEVRFSTDCDGNSPVGWCVERAEFKGVVGTTVLPVPEPGSWLMLLVALLVVAWWKGL